MAPMLGVTITTGRDALEAPPATAADPAGKENANASPEIQAASSSIATKIPIRPKLDCKPGFLTKHVQDMYLQKEIQAGRMSPDCFTNERVIGLLASENLNDHLYPWQIYSLTGREPIHALVTAFYNRVFADDEEEWFRAPFMKLSSQTYHVTAQSLMYTDCFGGGRLYWGGNDRLELHHRHEAAAFAIMTAKGAERWMWHMRAALNEREQELNKIDPRLRGAVAEFLHLFMSKYAAEYGFPEAEIDFGPSAQKN